MDQAAWSADGKIQVRARFKAGVAGIALIGCCVGVVTWLGDRWWPQHSPQDFEQCAAQVESTSSSKDERMTLMAQCDRQFAGRRKTGGGYTYYDFLQDRHFDIAGPNPTPQELKYFDEQYTSYLDAQRREAVAAAHAEKQNRTAQPGFQDDRVANSISQPGAAGAIAPTNVPIPRARNSVVQSSSLCEDGSLSCNWTRFSAGIKKFFESNARVNRPERRF
jgi:hypothetical protein